MIYDAWLRAGRNFALYYFEVSLGGETQGFRPTHYVDIAAVEPRKRDACFAHASQGARDGWYPKVHVRMQEYRGMEVRCRFAEAFAHHEQSPYGRLPNG